MKRTVSPAPSQQTKITVRFRVSAACLIAHYRNLPDRETRDYLEEVLAKNAYTQSGTDIYLPAETRDQDSWAAQCTNLSYSLSPELARAWVEWADEISKENLPEFERREAVRAMLGELIQSRDSRDVSQQALAEASIRTSCVIRTKVSHLYPL